MTRPCPVCYAIARTEIFSMTYRVPDHWPLPDTITWVTCDHCNMIFGDGPFNQALLDEYYRNFYGYGVSNPDNTQRLKMDAVQIESLLKFNHDTAIVDFGGAGDDGKSILVETLQERGFSRAVCIGPGDPLPHDCDVIYASHVLEHVYDLPETMHRLRTALAPDGLLIADVPDATGLLRRWKMPILDFNTKHINHFTLRNLLDLGYYHGLELVSLRQYELEVAPAWQAHFRVLDTARESMRHIQKNMDARRAQLEALRDLPVNIWGMSDIVWHLLSQVDLNVLDYIDNDPAYRGQTYNGKPVLERPTNNAPIVILAQGQRQRLIANIRAAGIENPIIEV